MRAVGSPATGVNVILSGGVGLSAALRVLEDVRRGCDRMAEAFVGVFMEELWGPSGRDSEAVAAVESLRPAAARTVLAVFEQAMVAEAERAFARELDR